jgi:hypothetical protein
MMGERRVMQALFYGFSPERHVPDSSLLREIDRFVDLSGLRAHLGPYYSLPTPNSPYKGEGLKSPPDRRRNRYPLSSAEVLQHTIRRLPRSGEGVAPTRPAVASTDVV